MSFLNCPQLANVWWERGAPCPIDHSYLLNLTHSTFLESLYWCKLRPQCLHFENVVTGVKAVNPRAQGMNKTQTQPVLL